MPARDARLVQIAGGHLDIDLVADADADEIFAPLAGDRCEHFIAVRQRHPKHRAGQHSGNVST